jgi:hypothetical protein
MAADSENSLRVEADRAYFAEPVRRTSENAVMAKFTGVDELPYAPALMLQVAGRGIGHSLRSTNISLQ